MQYVGMRAYQIIHSKFEEEEYAESIEIVRYYGYVLHSRFFENCA